MADITKCDWKDCNKKEQCYRFTALSSEFRQSYFSQTPNSENCEYFINNKLWKQ